MIIGVDLHGVIDSDPEWFKEMLGQLMFDIGGYGSTFDVYIISGPPKKDIRAELEKISIHHGLHYDEICSVVDHLKEKGAKMWQDDRDRWWASNEEWWKAKAEICEIEDVDIMIDDKKEWMPHFKNIKTKFLLYRG
jgi:hypothetical protein